MRVTIIITAFPLLLVGTLAAIFLCLHKYILLLSATQDLLPPLVIQSAAAAKSRFRSACQFPLVQWSSKQTLWVPPVCKYAVVYMGVSPLEDVRGKLQTGAFSIHVDKPSEIGALESVVGDAWPAVLIMDRARSAKYLWRPSISGDDLNDFLNSVAAGTAPRFLKSEPLSNLSADNGGDPDLAPLDINSEFLHKYIVDPKGRQIAFRDHDVMVTFHAPWCGHCRVFKAQFDPVVKELLRKDAVRVRFFKVDVTANDVELPFTRISHVPMTYFFPAASRGLSPQEFSERKNVKEGLISFLKQNSIYHAESEL